MPDCYEPPADPRRSGIHTTAQFTAKVFAKDPTKPHTWSSTVLSNPDFNEDKTSFYADNIALELSEDGTTYTIKSLVDENCVINMKITRTAPGFQVGKNGTTLYGTDLENPWGSMRHAFWPRCTCEGTMTTAGGPVDFEGQAYYVYALQGMKPHHAAARWNFCNFQGPTYSATVMQFTTPPSYGSTKVTVGAVAIDGEIITANCESTATHVKTVNEGKDEWPAPSEVKFTWGGKTKDGKAVEGVVESDLGERLDRIDVMAEVPVFVKKIVATAVGTRPYVYQVSSDTT
ncbi:hypothetical protein IMZ48_17145 [Candidatus Bathyarchaeota archaeon]|nr:hypothetical protein [Candidatus Bathyarchaeota archaeon]